MAQAAAHAKSAKASMYRGLVLAAAERLFATRGYDRTKIQDIAAASGLSLGTLYSVFDGKADIFEAIHDDRLSELFALAGEAVGASAPALDRLLDGNRVFVRWLTEHPDFLKIHLANSAWASNPTEASEGQMTAWRRGIDLIASVTRRGDARRHGSPGQSCHRRASHGFDPAGVHVCVGGKPDGGRRRCPCVPRRGTAST